MAHFAVPLSGGVLVTLNTRLAPAEIVRILEHSGAEILIGDAPLLEPALQGLSTVRSLRRLVTVPAESGDPVTAPVRGPTTSFSPRAATNRWPSPFRTRIVRSA